MARLPRRCAVFAIGMVEDVIDALSQGVYVLRTENKKLRVIFVPVTTGVSGATDIQVLGGLQAGDEIVTGRYKVLRTLKSGTTVKRDNTPEVAGATDNS